MIDINFSYLFKVEVLHEYFSGLACNDITIIPTAITVGTMNQYKMLSKTDNNLLIIGIQGSSSVNPLPPPLSNFTPLILPSSDTCLSFYIFYSNPLFFNYSEIPFGAPSLGNIFYFTNRNTNENNSGTRFITSAINNSAPFNPGDLFVNPADDTVYQSLGNNPTSANLSNPILWRATDKNRFATANDLVCFLPKVSTHNLPTTINPTANNPLTVTLLGYNTSLGTYTTPVLNYVLTFQGPVSECQLDLSTIPSGKYNLQLSCGGNISNQFIYLDDALTSSSGLLGVIDIYFDSTLPADYLLLDTKNFLKSPTYSICFLNRASYWNYNLLPTSPAGATVSDSGGFFSFNSSQSVSPIPFMDRPSYKFKLTPANSSTPILNIPCAAPENLSSAYNSAFYYSEIYLNY